MVLVRLLLRAAVAVVSTLLEYPSRTMVMFAAIVPAVDEALRLVFGRRLGHPAAMHHIWSQSINGVPCLAYTDPIRHPSTDDPSRND